MYTLGAKGNSKINVPLKFSVTYEHGIIILHVRSPYTTDICEYTIPLEKKKQSQQIVRHFLYITFAAHTQTYHNRALCNNKIK